MPAVYASPVIWKSNSPWMQNALISLVNLTFMVHWLHLKLSSEGQDQSMTSLM